MLCCEISGVPSSEIDRERKREKERESRKLEREG